MTTFELDFTSLDNAFDLVPESLPASTVDVSTGETHTWTYSNHRGDKLKAARLFKTAARRTLTKLRNVAKGDDGADTVAIRAIAALERRSNGWEFSSDAPLQDATYQITSTLRGMVSVARDAGHQSRQAARAVVIAELNAEIHSQNRRHWMNR